MAEQRALISLDGRIRQIGDADIIKNAMAPSVYDPQAIAGDVFSLANMTGSLPVGQVSGAGSSITVDVGTGANEIVQLDGLGRLPALDGSNLFNLPAPDLIDLTDVNVTSVADNDIIAWDLASGKFTNQSVAEAGLATSDHNHDATYEALANKGAASGYCPLDTGSKVPTTYLPDSIVGAVSYKGVWNASTNTPTLLNGSGAQGEYYKVSVAGTTALDGISDWQVGDWVISDGTVWSKVDNTDLVSSVAGRTGAVTLTQADVSGLTTSDSPSFVALTLTGGLTIGSGEALTIDSTSFLSSDSTEDGVFIGKNAGANVSATSSYCVLIGSSAGANVTTSSGAVLIGRSAGQAATSGSDGTVCIGTYTGQIATGLQAVALGYATGKKVGTGSVYVGAHAGSDNTGTYNIGIGRSAGYSGDGSYNVFIGNAAGADETGSRKLYIDISNTSDPLIYGDFLSRDIKINGNFETTGTITSTGLVNGRDMSADGTKLDGIDVMVGDTGSGGTQGLAPAPVAGDAVKFLRGDGTWARPSRAQRYFFAMMD